jgi:hypothetical protein
VPAEALEPIEPIQGDEAEAAFGSRATDDVFAEPARQAAEPSGATIGSARPDDGLDFDLELATLDHTGASEADTGPDDSGAEPDSDAGPALAGETLGASVMFELQRMRPDEKVRLATKANRQQRQVLLRDRTPQVLLALLNNPWLENAEVLEMAKNPKVVGPVLQRLADDRRFGVNAQVQSALARNPSTPWTVTTRLLPLLHTRELRELARSPHVREAVRKAALKLYLGRM